jgi:dihydrofolate synthase / folylpolyglutamate synthase
LARNYSEELSGILQELYARQPEQHVRPRLAPTARAVEVMGDPQRNYGIIHITGTNGKTSTARIIERILREHGLRTGRLTSPHLVSFNERISLYGEPVSDEVLVETYLESKPLLELVDSELIAAGEVPLTFFEAFTAVAFQLFSDAPIDVLVLEVGMGGEWDATNVADADVAVFTAIDLDHQKSLGNTIAEIAKTKSGIIKPGSLVVSSPQSPEAAEVLSSRAEVLFSGAQFGFSDVVPDGFGTRFSVQGLAGEYPVVWMPLLGEHQAENAATAIAAVELFLGEGRRAIADEVLRQALADCVSPGRLHVVSKDPLILLDGAHNPHGLRALGQALKFHFPGRRTVGLVGMLADKDITAAAEEMAQLFNQVIVTTAPSPRGLEAEALARALEDAGAEVLSIEPDIALANQLLLRQLDQDSVGVVAGSLYLVGEVLGLYREDDSDE